MPIVVKDLDGTLAGAPYHAGNKAAEGRGYVATTTSYLFEKLEAAGFVIVGKTNTPEFGLMTDHRAARRTVRRTTRGTLAHTPAVRVAARAAAVASGMVPLAHAGDGGGSIRIPPRACAVCSA